MKTFLLIAAVLAPCARAEFLQIDQRVSGMDCASCNRAVSADLKKTRGVESFELSPNQDLLRIILKPGNALRVEQVWEVIRRNGVTLLEAKVVVRGEIRVEEGKPQLQATSTGPPYELIGDTEEIRRRTGQTLVIEGETTPGPSIRNPAPIRWKGVKN